MPYAWARVRNAAPARQSSRLAREQGGGAIIEFAFGAIVLFGLAAGIMDLSRAMHILDTIEHASREGVRYAAIHGDSSKDPKTDADIEAFTKDIAATTLETSKLTTQVSWDPDRNAGSRVTVTVSFDFSHMFTGLFPATEFDLTAESTYTATR